MKFYEFILHFVILDTVAYIIISIIAGTFKTKNWDDNTLALFIYGIVVSGLIAFISVVT